MQTIVDQLQKEIAKALGAPEIKQQFLAEDFQIIGSTSSELDSELREQISQMKELIVTSGLAEK